MGTSFRGVQTTIKMKAVTVLCVLGLAVLLVEAQDSQDSVGVRKARDDDWEDMFENANRWRNWMRMRNFMYRTRGGNWGGDNMYRTGGWGGNNNWGNNWGNNDWGNNMNNDMMYRRRGFNNRNYNNMQQGWNNRF